MSLFSSLEKMVEGNGHDDDLESEPQKSETGDDEKADDEEYTEPSRPGSTSGNSSGRAMQEIHNSA